MGVCFLLNLPCKMRIKIPAYGGKMKKQRKIKSVLDRFSFFFCFWFGHDSVESFLNFF